MEKHSAMEYSRLITDHGPGLQSYFRVSYFDKTKEARMFAVR